MNSHILHIGLQICAHDFENFYCSVLGFEQIQNFELTAENSEKIFQIAGGADVKVGFCRELQLELFVTKSNTCKSFNHICFESDRIADIESKALKYNYRTVLLEHSGTLFLMDASNNIFEIKPIK
ncbi:MAG: hypothetical protein EOM47_14500 [Bacteroidia bacterium]|nr:hypothetical protein [Bacteroidia bacterium]